VLEALMFQRMVLHCRKHKSDAHAAQLASRLLEWLQAQTNRLTGDEQVFPTETFSNEPLADAMLPIAAFLVDQKSADFIQDLFKRQIVSSWVQSFKQFEKMCRILIN
jgi:hypothetical protein